jgi:hypothetical protein
MRRKEPAGSSKKRPAAAGRKPSSVRLRAPRGALRRDDHSSSPTIAGGIKQPTRRSGTGRSLASAAVSRDECRASLFGLAPCGVLPATDVATGAVRSYRTFSPLPDDARKASEAGRYIFCATFLRVAPTGRYPAHCPEELGLSSRLRPLRGLRRSKPGACRAAARSAKAGDRLAHCGETSIIRHSPG